MRPDLIEVLPPGRELRAGVAERAEQGLVQALIPQTPVEAFVEAVLLRLARRDVMPADAGIVGPAEDGVGGVFRAVVADDGVRRRS